MIIDIVNLLFIYLFMSFSLQLLAVSVLFAHFYWFIYRLPVILYLIILLTYCRNSCIYRIMCVCSFFFVSLSYIFLCSCDRLCQYLLAFLFNIVRTLNHILLLFLISLWLTFQVLCPVGIQFLYLINVFCAYAYYFVYHYVPLHHIYIYYYHLIPLYMDCKAHVSWYFIHWNMRYISNKSLSLSLSISYHF